ncbi:MAG: class I SAM-dependent methyltransferase [Actinomycetota bacterium]|nr:class I SAM-dependent methyltransferase [Actinomycetota bacterium]
MTQGVERDRVSPYSISSFLYDRLVGRYAFEQWRDNFERLEIRYPLRMNLCADVACGTGLAARYLAARGARVFAVDRSREMLIKASEIAVWGTTFIRQDMRYLSLPLGVDVIVCATDSLNYMLREKDIRRVIRSFYLNLNSGGYALFDMNTIWQLREGADVQPWEFDMDGHALRWVSGWDAAADTAVLEFAFLDMADERGVYPVEIHREKGYPLSWISGELREAGFDGVEVLDASTLGRVGDKTRRAQFVAHRN